MHDCIVISDLHLGSGICEAKSLEHFLLWAVEHCKELVINGDVFDDLNFCRLRKHHFACLKILRKNTDREDLKVTWVRGNHDGSADVVSHILGIPVCTEYVFDNGSIRALILHGDKFDYFVGKYPIIIELACWMFYYIQKYTRRGFSKWIRRMSKRFQRSNELIKTRAIACARRRGYPIIICGHTHFSCLVTNNSITYANCGCWVECSPFHYVTIDGPDVELMDWDYIPSLADHTCQEPEIEIQIREAG